MMGLSRLVCKVVGHDLEQSQEVSVPGGEDIRLVECTRCEAGGVMEVGDD